MSNYTTQLRFICESYAGKKVPTPQSEIDEIIKASREDIFNFDYPIFDPDYKETLESKILSHYYTEEIGSETVGLWKHQLKNKMREIMPFYNQMYMSEKIKFDPLVNTILNDTRQTAGETNEKTSQDTSHAGSLGYSEKSQTDNTVTGGRDIRDDKNASYEKNNANSESLDRSRSVAEDTTDTKTGTEALAKTGTDTVTHTGTDTLAYMGKAEKKDELTKEGSELNVNYPAHNLSTLRKHSDTPLGGIDGTVDGSQVPAVTGGGAGAVENYSNYLSDVVEEISNFDRNPATGSGAHRKANRDIVRYGRYWEDENGSQTDPRKDTHTITEDYAKFTGDNARKDQQTKNLTDLDTRNMTDTTTYNTTDKGDHDTTETENADRMSNGLERGNDEAHNVSHETSNETGQAITSNSGDRLSNDKTTATNDSNITENKDYFGRLFGKTGSVSLSKLLMEYRQTFLNIDVQVIEELQPLFMGIW